MTARFDVTVDLLQQKVDSWDMDCVETKENHQFSESSDEVPDHLLETTDNIVEDKLYFN